MRARKRKIINCADNLIHRQSRSPFPNREGWRITPELRFIKDGSIEHGAKIAKFLEEINSQNKEN